MLMEIVSGAIAGLVWGALIAWLNSRITKKALAENDTQKLMTANISRTVIDFAALGIVFLLRKILPVSFEACMVGTAVSLGLLTVFFAYRMSKPE